MPDPIPHTGAVEEGLGAASVPDPIGTTDLLPLDADGQLAMEAAARHSLGYRQALTEARVTPRLRPAEIAARFDIALPETGKDALSVIEELVRDATDCVHGHTSPRFFGYVCGGSMPVDAAADFLVTAWGQNAASSWESPAVAVIEQTLCRWCLELLGLPADCGAGVVTGATVANTQAIMAARDALLVRRGWNVVEHGLFGAPQIPVLIGADAHSGPLAGLRYAGFGLGQAVRVATDDQGRIRLDALERALAACENPP